MATMKTLNGYGFNATELNGKTSDSYLQKTDTASDTSKLGGKAPEYYLQPHNLFDNSNFVDPVMQAEFNGMHGNEQYVIDRWLHLYNLGSSEKVYGGIAMTGADFYMAQKVGEDVSGKTLTFAVCLADGTVVCGTENVGDLSSTIVFVQHENLYLMLYNGYFSIRTTTGTYTIKWAALYEGSYTADTLPPYVPKGYAAELAECQRYFRKGAQAVTIGTQFSSGSLFALSVPRMRIKPTVTLTEISSQGWGNVTASNYTLDWNGDLGSSFYANYIYSVSDDVGKTVVVSYEMSADL